MQNFNYDLSKVSPLPTSAWDKTVTATISSFNSKPQLLSFCFEKSVNVANASILNSGKSITGSNLNIPRKSLRDVGAVSTCNRYDVATYRSN